MQLDHEFTSVSWLQDHHDCKLAERRKIVQNLGLRDGDKVLDAGCGPGLWLPLLRDMIGRAGSIVGCDLDYQFLHHAQQWQEDEEGAPARLLVRGDFSATPFRAESFDFVFSSNSLLYHPSPLALLRHFHSLVRPGGRIAIVHFDDAMTCYHPIEPELTLRVLTATAEALRNATLGTHYDNYMGRKLHSIFVKSSLVDIETSVQPVYRHAPLDPVVENHIRGIARWQGRIGATQLDEATQRTWLSYFDPQSPNYVLRDPQFTFCTMEFVTAGTRRSAAAEVKEIASA